MLLTDARRAGADRSGRRPDPAGRAGPVEVEQAGLIVEGEALVSRRALADPDSGRTRCRPRSPPCTRPPSGPKTPTGAQIVALYQVLEQISDNPMVRLNHAVAVAMAIGPKEGLACSSRSSRTTGSPSTTGSRRCARTCWRWSARPGRRAGELPARRPPYDLDARAQLPAVQGGPTELIGHSLGRLLTPSRGAASGVSVLKGGPHQGVAPARDADRDRTGQPYDRVRPLAAPVHHPHGRPDAVRPGRRRAVAPDRAPGRRAAPGRRRGHPPVPGPLGATAGRTTAPGDRTRPPARRGSRRVAAGRHRADSRGHPAGTHRATYDAVVRRSSASTTATRTWRRSSHESLVPELLVPDGFGPAGPAGRSASSTTSRSTDRSAAAERNLTALVTPWPASK